MRHKKNHPRFPRERKKTQAPSAPVLRPSDAYFPPPMSGPTPHATPVSLATSGSALAFGSSALPFPRALFPAAQSDSARANFPKRADSGNSKMHNKRDSDTCCKSMISSMVGIYSFLVMSRNGGMQSGALFVYMCFIFRLKYVPLNIKLLRFPVSKYSETQSCQKNTTTPVPTMGH